MEGAGVIEAVGEGVTSFQPGDRVAYAGGPIGAYAEARLMPADRLVPLPSWIDDKQAAAMMLQGMTAQFLIRSCYAVQPGDTILVHAAAGGVGLILCQWARKLGVTVIGTVGSVQEMLADPPEWLQDWARQVGAKLEDGLREAPSSSPLLATTETFSTPTR